ncbi:hypothetical protein BD779DRAFT_859472 [Infundibulicybe gibba]|nr:hypothetical protein BD779DRAFT_859472 [Infundibulicybe gibba]
MEEAVAAWKVARSYVLRLSWNDHQGVPSSPPTNGARTHKKRRHNESSPNSAEELELRLVSPQRTKSKAEDNPRPPHGWRPLGQRKQNDGTVPSSDIDEIEMTAETLKDEFVTCPLCNASVKLKRINEHMDRNCDQLGSVEQAGNKNSKQKEWGKIMGQSGKGKANDDDAFPLPKASYGTLKDKKIREMLSEHGLPTHGERSACIQRHQRWVILYNANLDRAVAHRKTKGELRKDLKRWEDERNKKSKTVVDDIMAYEKNNKSEFARLIEATRSRQVTKSAYFPDTMTPSTSNKSPTILPQPEDASPIVVDSQENN